MKVYLIKRKGKTWIGNFLGSAHEFSVGKHKGWIHYAFYTKKDAKKYLASYPYPEYMEIISAEIAKSKQDNRRTNP